MCGIYRNKNLFLAGFLYQFNQFFKRRHLFDGKPVFGNAVKVRNHTVNLLGTLFNPFKVGWLAEIGTAVDFHVAGMIYRCVF